jgi:glutathione S-transferase
MSENLVFYTNPMSRGRIARWMLEEVAQPYQTILLDFPAMKMPDYLAINPMGKVPAISHRGALVTECAAICAYLADAFPQAGLAPPPDSPARAPYYRWLFFAAGPVEAAITNKTFGFELPPGRDVSAGYGSFAAVMDTMEAAITGRDYLAGGEFSAADVYFGCHIGFGLRFNTIEKRPAFEAYFARLAARPAYQRANEIDDKLLSTPKE